MGLLARFSIFLRTFVARLMDILQSRMKHLTYLLFPALLTSLTGLARTVVIDTEEQSPLPMASVFNSNGTIVGTTDDNGFLPQLKNSDFPLTLRYLGYDPVSVASPDVDSVRMSVSVFELPELAVGPVNRPIVRMTAYVREYASMTTSNDTVDMFLDYMGAVNWTTEKVKSFKQSRDGAFRRSSERVRGYSRHISAERDSIMFPSEEDIAILSLESMISIPTEPVREEGPDTVEGKYGIERLSVRTPGQYRIVTDALADKKNHSWSPWFLKLLGLTTEFTRFQKSLVYPADTSGVHRPETLLANTFTLEAIARGKWMKKMLNSEEPVSIKWYYEIYPTGVEYLSVEEWQAEKQNSEPVELTVPASAPPLSPTVLRNIEAVSNRQ